MTVRAIAALALMLSGAACSEDIETPTSATASAACHNSFFGHAAAACNPFLLLHVDNGWHGIGVARQRRAKWRSLRPNALELGIGSPAGTGCAVTSSANVSAALIPQLRHEASCRHLLREGRRYRWTVGGDDLHDPRNTSMRIRIAAICWVALLAGACEDAASPRHPRRQLISTHSRASSIPGAPRAESSL